jgi:hypothetical protein
VAVSTKINTVIIGCETDFPGRQRISKEEAVKMIEAERGDQANIKAYMLARLLACFVNQSRIASTTMSCCDHGAVRSSFRETATLMSSFTRSAGNR